MKKTCSCGEPLRPVYENVGFEENPKNELVKMVCSDCFKSYGSYCRSCKEATPDGETFCDNDDLCRDEYNAGRDMAKRKDGNLPELQRGLQKIREKTTSQLSLGISA